MKRWVISAFCAVMLLAAPMAAAAEYETVRELREASERDGELRAYIAGFLAADELAATNLLPFTEKLLYLLCPSQNTTLQDMEQVLLRDLRSSGSGHSDMPASIFVYTSLHFEYPCDGERQGRRSRAPEWNRP